MNRPRILRTQALLDEGRTLKREAAGGGFTEYDLGSVWLPIEDGPKYIKVIVQIWETTEKNYILQDENNS